MHFFKLSGAGNDFVAFDNRDGTLPPDEARPAWFARLCRRGTGVGADGVLIVERSADAHVRMRYHNADGGETEMCGNGLRCLVRFAHHLGAAPAKMTVQTGAGLHHGEIVDHRQVRVTLTDPEDIRRNVDLSLEGHPFRGTVMRNGVPHVAILLDGGEEALRAFDLARLGPALRSHAAVMPEGANINLGVRAADGAIAMRTYERGVEAETLACGTGAATVALTFAVETGRGSPVDIRTSSGDMLKIHFKRDGDTFSEQMLEGPAVINYEGNLRVPLLPPAEFSRV